MLAAQVTIFLLLTKKIQKVSVVLPSSDSKNSNQNNDDGHLNQKLSPLAFYLEGRVKEKKNNQLVINLSENEKDILIAINPNVKIIKRELNKNVKISTEGEDLEFVSNPFSEADVKMEDIKINDRISAECVCEGTDMSGCVAKKIIIGEWNHL